MTKKEKKINVLLADDHSIIRDGLKSLLANVPGIFICGEAADGLEVMNLLKTTPTDVVVMDVNMPRLNGIETTRRIKGEYPHIRIIALTMYNQSDTIKTMVEEGVWGYLLKDSSSTELIGAIENVSQGRKYFNNDIFDLLLMNPENNKEDGAGDKSMLTTREKEILKLIAEEYASKEIADKLFLSINTVNAHRRNLVQKLGTKNTAALVRYAIKNGIIRLDEDQ